MITASEESGSKWRGAGPDQLRSSRRRFYLISFLYERPIFVAKFLPTFCFLLGAFANGLRKLYDRGSRRSRFDISSVLDGQLGAGPLTAPRSLPTSGTHDLCNDLKRFLVFACSDKVT